MSKIFVDGFLTSKLRDGSEIVHGEASSATLTRVDDAILESKDACKLCHCLKYFLLIKVFRNEQLVDELDYYGLSLKDLDINPLVEALKQYIDRYPPEDATDLVGGNRKPAESKKDGEKVSCCSNFFRNKRNQTNATPIAPQNTNKVEEQELSFATAIHAHSPGVRLIEDDDGSRFDSIGTYRGMYQWPNALKSPDVYLGEFFEGKFDGYGKLDYSRDGFYLGQFEKDMHQGVGVQIWKRTASTPITDRSLVLNHIFLGEWKRNQECGVGVQYTPVVTPSGGLAYSLYFGHFDRGHPTLGTLVEGQSLKALSGADISFEQGGGVRGEVSCSQESESEGAARQVEYDRRTAFWQVPTPVTRAGVFVADVKMCEFDTRAPKRGGMGPHESPEEITWYSWVEKADAAAGAAAAAAAATASNPRELNIMTAHAGGEGPVAAGKAEPWNLLSRRTLHRRVRFHGTCARNKQGYFPCPRKGVLYDQDCEFHVEYDGSTLLVDNPLPHLVVGDFECSARPTLTSAMAHTDEGPFRRKKSVIDRSLGDLSSIKLLEDPSKASRIHFHGQFESKFFPLFGIILLDYKLFRVEFDGVLHLQRVIRYVKTSSDEKATSKKPDDGKKPNVKTRRKKVIDEDPANTQIVDFDKLVAKLKREKKMVEIVVPSKPRSRKTEAPELRKPRQAIQEAVKVLSGELWSSNGLLTKRFRDNPQDTLQISSHEFDGTNGAMYLGWFRKVYCPSLGSGVVESVGPTKDKNHVKNINLLDCLLYPGTEEWVVFLLDKIKWAHLSNMKARLVELMQEVSDANLEIQRLDTELEYLESHKRQVEESKFRMKNEDVDMVTALQRAVFDPGRKVVKCESFDGELRKVNASINSAHRRRNILKEAVVRHELNAAKCRELTTDLSIAECKMTIETTLDKLESMLELLETLLADYRAQVQHTDADVEAKQKALADLRGKVAEVTRKAANNSGNEVKKALADIKKVEMEAKLLVEVSKQNPELAAVRSDLLACTSHVLDGAVAVDNTLHALDLALMSKSQARLMTEAALVRRDRWLAERPEPTTGGDRASARTAPNGKPQQDRRLELLMDELDDLRNQQPHTGDAGLQDFAATARQLAAYAEAEARHMEAWTEAVKDEGTLNPSSSLAVATDKRRGEMLRSLRDEMDMYAVDEQPREAAVQEAWRELWRVVAAGQPCAGATELALLVLEVAVARRAAACSASEKFDELDSRPALTRLETALLTCAPSRRTSSA